MNKDKNISDYLHLYLGCEIKAISKWRNYTVGKVYKLNTAILNDFEVNERSGDIICKPILRPLSDMTEEENKEAFNSRGNGDGLSNNIPEAHEIKYYLSKGFDLFGLIESGLAIDKTKLQSK